MAIRKIDGHWIIDIRGADKKRIRWRSPHNSKGSAKEYEIQLRRKLARGEELDTRTSAPQKTFAEFSSQWFETYVKTNNKPSEMRQKRIILDRHLLPQFGSMLLSQITTREVEEFKASKLREGLMAKTVNNQLAVLGRCLRTAIEWDELDHCPRVRLLRTAPPRFDFLSREEAALLVSDATEPMWTAMLRVALGTGMRAGELLALSAEDVDIERRILTVRSSIVRGILSTPKNHRIRHIPLTADLSGVFLDLPRSGFVFQRRNGTPVTLGMAEAAIQRQCKRVGLRPIGWHVLRHTFASLLAEAGVPIPVLKDLLGHQSIAMTMRYAHLAPSAFTDAIAVLERSLPENFGHQMGTELQTPALAA